MTRIRRRTKATRFCLLVLALLVGQVQARSVFQCAMMDEVIHGECCCATNRTADDCGGSGCDGAASGLSERCCDHSVELSFNPEAQDQRPVIKPYELRTGVDPPPAIFRSIPLNVLAPARTALVVPSLPTDAHLIRSDTYLLTRRLRI